VRSRAQDACRLEEPHASQSHDIQTSVGISLSFDISPRREIFGLDYPDGQQGFQTIFEEIAGDHPGYAAVVGAPLRIPSG
jgi:hypothetical protein